MYSAPAADSTIRAKSASAVGAQEIARDLIWSAARKGERGVAIARILVGTAIVICWLTLHRDSLQAFVPRAIAVVVTAIVALGWSFFVLHRLRKERPSTGLMVSSITIDALIIHIVLWFYIEFPASSHDSVVEVHGSTFVYLAIITAGARVSTLAATWGAIVNSILFTALVAYSTWHEADWKIIGPIEWITVAAGLVGSTILSMLMSSRTREMVYRSAMEAKSAERAIAKLGAYVSSEFAEELLKQEELRLGGVLQPVAILFSDLRGFTSYSEGLAPDELVQQLNEYLEIMVSAINKHGGVVDKFMGDGIMAVFGAPVPAADDADRAVQAAQEMMQQLERLNTSRQKRNLVPLRQGIGIHYGEVIAGNVGSPSRASYTVIGDTVNLASRLESASKREKRDVLISEAAKEKCPPNTKLDYVGEIEVPGKRDTVIVYSLPQSAER